MGPGTETKIPTLTVGCVLLTIMMGGFLQGAQTGLDKQLLFPKYVHAIACICHCSLHCLVIAWDPVWKISIHYSGRPPKLMC